MMKKRFIPQLEAVILLLGILILLIILILTVAPGSSRQTMVVKGGGAVCDIQPVELPRGGVPINAADVPQLDELPGIGPKTAQAILEERQANGPFFYPEDLAYVKGIGPKTIEKIKELLSFGHGPQAQ